MPENRPSESLAESLELFRKIHYEEDGKTESKDVLFSSEDEKAKPETTNMSERRVSVISWGDTKSKVAESSPDAAAMESKMRVESRISQLITERKMRDKNSIFHDVVRSEKKKTELDAVLANAETSSVCTATNGSFMVPKKTKCCGLIKVKPNPRSSEVDSEHGMVVKRKSHKKANSTSRSVYLFFFYSCCFIKEFKEIFILSK